MCTAHSIGLITIQAPRQLSPTAAIISRQVLCAKPSAVSNHVVISLQLSTARSCCHGLLVKYHRLQPISTSVLSVFTAGFTIVDTLAWGALVSVSSQLDAKHTNQRVQVRAW